MNWETWVIQSKRPLPRITESHGCKTVVRSLQALLPFLLLFTKVLRIITPMLRTALLSVTVFVFALLSAATAYSMEPIVDKVVVVNNPDNTQISFEIRNAFTKEIEEGIKAEYLPPSPSLLRFIKNATCGLMKHWLPRNLSTL